MRNRSLAFWSIYSVFAAVGLLLLPSINKRIFGQFPDGPALFCYLLGILGTSFGVFFVREKQSIHMRFELVAGAFVGFFAFLPGLLILWLI